MQNVLSRSLSSCFTRVKVSVNLCWIIWAKKSCRYLHICKYVKDTMKYSNYRLMHNKCTFFFVFVSVGFFFYLLQSSQDSSNITMASRSVLQPDQSCIPDFLPLQAEPDTSYSFTHNRPPSQSSSFSSSLNVLASPKRTVQNGF